MNCPPHAGEFNETGSASVMKHDHPLTALRSLSALLVPDETNEGCAGWSQGDV